jgi:hypothetical protein
VQEECRLDGSLPGYIVGRRTPPEVHSWIPDRLTPDGTTPPDGILEPFENIRTFLVANHVISAASITILGAGVTATQLKSEGERHFPFVGWLLT